MNLPTLRPPRSRTQLMLIVVGMSGIPALFLPFTFDISPVRAAFGNESEQWRLALPFFLSIFISAASIRWFVSGSFSLLECALAYSVSAASAGLTLSFYWGNSFWSLHPQEQIAMAAPAATLFFGVWALIRNSRAGRPRELSPVLAIQVAYLANGTLCLIGFFGGWQAGAYVVLVTATVYVLQIILLLAQPGRLAGGITGGP